MKGYFFKELPILFELFEHLHQRTCDQTLDSPATTDRRLNAGPIAIRAARVRIVEPNATLVCQTPAPASSVKVKCIPFLSRCTSAHVRKRCTSTFVRFGYHVHMRVQQPPPPPPTPIVARNRTTSTRSHWLAANAAHHRLIIPKTSIEQSTASVRRLEQQNTNTHTHASGSRADHEMLRQTHQLTCLLPHRCDDACCTFNYRPVSVPIQCKYSRRCSHGFGFVFGHRHSCHVRAADGTHAHGKLLMTHSDGRNDRKNWYELMSNTPPAVG